MTGMGETEQEMARVIQRSRDMGGRSHLFSFFPESGSALADRPQPPMSQYRHVQLARYLIDEGLGRENGFTYNPMDRITDFGLSPEILEPIIDSGEPFRTSGCTGRDGQVACNRPFANSRPGPELRNYPFPPNPEDIRRIRTQMLEPERHDRPGVNGAWADPKVA